MLGDAGSLGGLEQTAQEENKEEIAENSSEEVEAIAEVEEAVPSDDNVEEKQDLEDEEITLPSGPPSGRLVNLQLAHQVAHQPDLRADL